MSLIVIFLITLFQKQFNIFSVFSSTLAIYLVVLTFYKKVYYLQAIEDGIRYFTPSIVLVYSFQIRHLRILILSILLFYILVADFYQTIFFITQSLSANKLWTHRATGFLNFFDFFGFVNFIGIIIVNELWQFMSSRHSFILKTIHVLFLLWALSLKITVLLVLYVIVKEQKILLPTLSLIGTIFFLSESIKDLTLLRAEKYLIKQESARNKSYRMVANNIEDFWLIGTGSGTFGGPASTKYNSELYNKDKFNWFGEKGTATTDSYYPHLFIELGVPFGILYLYVVLFIQLPLSKDKKSAFWIISFLSVNCIFSFALNSINYCFFSLLLMNFNLKLLNGYKCSLFLKNIT